MPDKDQDLKDGPVTEDENFVNVDPDFANYSNEVDRPFPMKEVEDYNVPEEFREAKKSEEKDEEEKKEPAKTPAPSTTPVTPPAAQTVKK